MHHRLNILHQKENKNDIICKYTVHLFLHRILGKYYNFNVLLTGLIKGIPSVVRFCIDVFLEQAGFPNPRGFPLEPLCLLLHWLRLYSEKLKAKVDYCVTDQYKKVS